MQSRARTVKEYLASLPEERRSAIETVRMVLRANLAPEFEEGTLEEGASAHRALPAPSASVPLDDGKIRSSL